MPAPSDYYQAPPDAEESGNLPITESSTEGEMPAEEGEDEYEGGSSALLPKSLVGDVQPGQTITLKVLHVYEDECEVAPVSSETGPGTPMDEAEAGLDKMAMEGME